jgi:N-acetylglucosaminyldiphosphoundecaprenol N-acetyl-beta-D-mannosaminyltransferase
MASETNETPDAPALPHFSVLGVRIHNATTRQAIETIEGLIDRRADRAAGVYFVNAHTLNLATADPNYRAALNDGDLVFADGTGVRWAARLQGIRILENLAGTDFVPALFKATPDRGHSCFLLGADAPTIEAAADYAARTFPGWKFVGCHPGYLTDASLNAAAIAKINEAKPDVLLVGMGNPLQEQWIRRNRDKLDVSVCLGIGGLFDFWAGNVTRSPRWLRRLGHEWLWRLFQEPRRKAQRYLVGNPLFLLRILADRCRGHNRGESRSRFPTGRG